MPLSWLRNEIEKVFERADPAPAQDVPRVVLGRDLPVVLQEQQLVLVHARGR
jgi:hypothetical protein